MDTKEARRLLANAHPDYKRASNNRVGEQRPARGDGREEFTRNTKEDAIIDAIDQKNFLLKHASWIEKLRDGHIDVPQFLGALSPDVALELAGIAFNGQSEKVRLAAIQDWLDRAGYSKVHKVAAAVIDPNAPKEQLIAMIEGLSRKTKAIEITDDDSDIEVETQEPVEP